LVFKDFDEIFGVLAVFVFDAIVVDNEHKLYCLGAVEPESMGVWGWALSMGF
jgi:hypothetical protein